MFEVGFAFAIFSYSVYLFGMTGLLYSPFLICFSLLYWFVFLIWKKKDIVGFGKRAIRQKYSLVVLFSLLYLFAQSAINAVGLFGPEIGFDATWYHLTLPKLYLLYHAIVHIPGGILYYSDMPRLTEMLFTAGLSFGSDFFARIFQYVFGILTCISLYKIGRKFLPSQWAILLPVIFYSNLVVGWESISGYIDLARTFFATLGLLAFLEWTEKKDQKFFIFSALFVGVTISTKLLAIPDIGMYAAALFFHERKHLALIFRLKRIALFVLLSLICPLPWFVFAFSHTGNPIFPVFSPVYPVSNYLQIFNPVFFLTTVWSTFAQASDPINPLYLASLPFLFLFGKKLWKEVPLLVLFTIGGLAIWYLTPQTGGGRYILPYLPVLTILSVIVISHLSNNFQKVFLFFIFFVAISSLMFRGVANAKFLPVIFHKETKAHFLQNHLQFFLGDFYDIDGYFTDHIKSTDRVLLYGFHNLYYVDFPFIDSSWVKKGDMFDYVAVQGVGMPERFRYWTLVYYNTTTKVRLYSLKGQMWRY